MHRFRFLDDVVVWAPAKVNLHLEVRGKRPDGYHDIETLMVAVRLYDTLVFRLAESEIRLDCYRPDLSTGPDNLVVKAATLLRERTGCTKGCHIRLVKRIPMQAGLAGGSADAAATLLGLNELWGLGRSRDELAALGAELGSDVPFFFHTPAAWCTGRGEVVEPAAVGRALDLVLLRPAFGMPTGPVYARVTVPETPHPGDAIRKALAVGDIEAIGQNLHNRLQPAAATIDARIAKYEAQLARSNPAGRLMSGSGSTLFALARSPDDAERIAAGLRQHAADEGYRVMLVRSCA
jgi:4-diphosphocytidyl-2-C-methyl-D-erythritol kinase